MPEERCRRRSAAPCRRARRRRNPDTGRPLFAFRLHQFLSKGDTVYVTLETEADRYLTRDYQRVAPGDRGQALLPLAFCRECGQEYLAVWRTETDGEVVYSRAATPTPPAADADNGYLYVNDRPTPGPHDPEEAIADRRLPESWLEIDEHGRRTSSRRPTGPGCRVRSRRPVRRSSAEASCAPPSSPPRSCSACAARSATSRSAGKDFAKLATLDAEGRSLGDLADLRVRRALPARAVPRRLDTRPASCSLRRQPAGRQPPGRPLQRLRAGHPVRGALYRAAVDAGEDGTPHEDLAAGRPRPSPSTSPSTPGEPDLAPRWPATHRPGPARCRRLPALPRPGARLARHHAQPGADRPAARSTTPTWTDRRDGGALGTAHPRCARPSRAAARVMQDRCSTRCAASSPSTSSALPRRLRLAAAAPARSASSTRGRSAESDTPRVGTAYPRASRAGLDRSRHCSCPGAARSAVPAPPIALPRRLAPTTPS